MRSHIGLFHAFVKYWRDAAASAAALGLGGDIWYSLLATNIELPEKVIVARKWFETAEKLTKAVDPSRLAKLTTDGERHIWAVDRVSELLAPGPVHFPYHGAFIKWNLLVAYWVHMVGLMVLVKSMKKARRATMDLITPGS